MRRLRFFAAALIAAAATSGHAAGDAWQQTTSTTRDGPEADLVVQLGDIDNLGFGWPEGFTPFSGKSTPAHSFPFQPEADDPSGTDRVMVVSGYGAGAGARVGYTYETSRPANAPKPLLLSFDLQGLEATSAALQLFVDDFQSPSMGSRFRAWLDDRETTDVPVVLNSLDQTGPIGKLLTIQLLPEYLDLLADGKLEIRIDDPDHDAGDGFAFDFARLLVNPKGFRWVRTASRWPASWRARAKPICTASTSTRPRPRSSPNRKRRCSRCWAC